MMATLGTFTAGQVLTAAELNSLTNVTRLFKNINQSVASSVEYTIPFNSGTTQLDVSLWHSPTVNPERITPTIAGYYLVFGSVGWDDFASEGDVYTMIRKNGSQAAVAIARGDFVPAMHAITIVEMNGSTDYLTLGSWQNRGGPQTISNCEFGCIFLRES